MKTNSHRGSFPPLALLFWSVLMALPVWGQMTAVPALSSASPVLSSPLGIGSLTLQVICEPEGGRLALPGVLPGSLSFEIGRLTPRQLLVQQNGSYTVIPLRQDSEFSLMDLFRLSETASSSRREAASDSSEVDGVQTAVSRLPASLRQTLEDWLGPLSRGRLLGWLWIGCSLASLLLSLPFATLVWQAAHTLQQRPGAALLTGAAANLLGGGLLLAFIHSRLGIPFLVISLPPLLLLILLLPAIFAASITSRLYSPRTLLSGTLGLLVGIPCLWLFLLIPTAGAVSFGFFCIWSLGAILLSPVLGPEKEITVQEEPSC